MRRCCGLLSTALLSLHQKYQIKDRQLLDGTPCRDQFRPSAKMVTVFGKSEINTWRMAPRNTNKSGEKQHNNNRLYILRRIADCFSWADLDRRCSMAHSSALPQRFQLPPDLISPCLPLLNHLTLAGPDPPWDFRVDADFPVPFKPEVAVPVPTIEVKERIHFEDFDFRGIWALKKRILKELEFGPTKLETVEERSRFVLEKAKELLEINNKVALELKYPKVNKGQGNQRCGILGDASDRRKFVKSQRIGDTSGPDRKNSSAPVKVVGKNDTMEQTAPQVGIELEVENSAQFERRLQEIFGDTSPIPELCQNADDYWQFKVKRSEKKTKQKNSTARFWKRNSYPPKTELERLKSLREKVSTKIIDTDLLSGIWIPQLMTSDFEITGINYDSRKNLDTVQGCPDWYQLQVIKEKCSQWLNKNSKFIDLE